MSTVPAFHAVIIDELKDLSVPTLRALLIEEFRDLFHAENQLINALPKMARAATNPELKARFTAHLAQTREHARRLTHALKLLGLPVPASGRPWDAMQGLVEEGAEAINLKGSNADRDAALIGVAQRIEHWEIAGYDTARAFAHALGENQVADLLEATLDEEGDTNQALTNISLTVNADALAAVG